ncbi:hypothetical protein FD754_015037 [Muntiacus muntjak]|uniref:Large ribosomal subunit protein bL34m n=1 Tax=Muntiacus muntjak TaxID=9888 RepID=A0A5N3VLJ1_MUNMU|nr:hypothetical protein FD754_015037 [Muntiacus muntjak]
MAFSVRSVGCLLGPVSRSAGLLGGRLPAMQQTRGRMRGNEHQPSSIKRKKQLGWIWRLRTPSGVQVILRHMHKGRKSLSHRRARHGDWISPIKAFPSLSLTLLFFFFF